MRKRPGKYIRYVFHADYNLLLRIYHPLNRHRFAQYLASTGGLAAEENSMDIHMPASFSAADEAPQLIPTSHSLESNTPFTSSSSPSSNVGVTESDNSLPPFPETLEPAEIMPATRRSARNVYEVEAIVGIDCNEVSCLVSLL